MKPAVNSKKKAIILGGLVGLAALWWYYTPYPWLGIVMGLFGGLFTYSILTVRKMERLRVGFFIGISIFVITTLTANILYLGYTSFMEWVRTWDTGYFVSGESLGSSPFPLPILIPTIILGKATFLADQAVWYSTQANSLDLFLVFMIPYLITFLVFDRGFCGWFCPLGGLPEAMSSLTNKRRWFLKFIEKKPAQPGGFSFTGSSGLKGWAEWFRYGILVAIIIWSIMAGFAIVNIISPALWLKSFPVFWIIIVLLLIFAVVLPFMTKRRWWCDILCPVGATLALLHRVGPFQIKIDKTKCNECMDCVQECRMYAMTPQGVERGTPNSGNCIRCGRCIEACPEEAIDIAFLGKYRNIRAPFITMIIAATLGWYLWFVVLLVAYSTRLSHFRGLN
ncbi:MAG: 4Fe-4S binding protein [Dehalococcoidales bacterium]|nr:4Fe-4S binding protein [Dehalococcoidales bacterium]